MQHLRLLHFRFLLALALGTPLARAEFPPETFPDDTYEEVETKAAEEEYLSPKKKQPASPEAKRRMRDGVARQSIPEEDSVAAPADFERRFRFSALGGLAVFSSSNSTADAYIQRLLLKNQMALGGMIDFQFARYFGVDLDAYYSASPSQPIQLVTNGPVEHRQLTEYGTLLGLRAELPLNSGDISWRPRITLGYGLVNTTQTSVTSAGTGTNSIQVTGIYIGAGIEVAIGKGAVGYADNAFSVTTSSSATGPSGFNRLRAGLNFKTFGPVWLGGLAMLRAQSSGVSPDVSNNLMIGETDRTLHFLGVVTLAL